MRFLPIIFLACLLAVSCGDDDNGIVTPNTGTTKTFAIDINSHIPCGAANAQSICVNLGYADEVHYRCKNPDNTGVYIYEVTCWRP